MDRFDVAIIGGGVVGCAIAHELGRYDVTVTLIERHAEVGFGTSKANSGIIHGGHQSHADTLKGRLEWAGNQMWGGLCDELGFGFARIGAFTVALTEDDLIVLDELMDTAATKGVPDVEWLDRERALRLEPRLTSDLVAAVSAPTTAVINPYEACFGLAESAARRGVAIRTGCAVTGLRHDGDIWGIGTSDGVVRARFVLNAAGVRAGDVAGMAGLDPYRIRARKGEEYLLDKRLRGMVTRVIYPCPTPVTKGTLVIPTYDGTLMIGPTAVEVDDPDDTETTTEGAAEVFAAAQRLVPGLSERDVIAEFAGVRAVLDDEDFRIGPTEAPGFFDVAGIQSPGLTAAPAIATLVVDQLREAGLVLAAEPAELAPLPQPLRFSTATRDEQQELATNDPRHGHIVCRCEIVTEAEVCDAIERGARTLDGIKFRTRAGMGRCQGGFCTGRCMQLLERELEMPITSITKRGGDSWLVIDRDDVQHTVPHDGPEVPA
jgi:glycerol-3-phosphate dehydrogenase